MSDQNDNQVYTIMLWERTLLFYKVALDFYEQNIQGDVRAIDEDADLKAILGEEERKNFEVYHELDRIEWSKSWIQTAMSG